MRTLRWGVDFRVVGLCRYIRNLCFSFFRATTTTTIRAGGRCFSCVPFAVEVEFRKRARRMIQLCACSYMLVPLPGYRPDTMHFMS